MVAVTGLETMYYNWLVQHLDSVLNDLPKKLFLVKKTGTYFNLPFIFVSLYLGFKCMLLYKFKITLQVLITKDYIVTKFYVRTMSIPIK